MIVSQFQPQTRARVKPLPAARYRIYSSVKTYASAAPGVIVARASGSATCALERAIAQRIGLEHVVAVNQARLGIYLAIKSLVTPARRHVLMSPYTIFDVVNMVLAAGGLPVFVDIDPATCNIDPTRVARSITNQTSVVLITHLHGLACDVESIASLCRNRGVALVEDAAQALGACVNGRPVGTWGDAGIFSFGVMKNVNSFFGGAVVTCHPDLAATVRREQASFPRIPRIRLLTQVLRAAAFDLSTMPPVFKTVTFHVFRFGAIHQIRILNQLSRSENHPVRRDALLRGIRHRMTDAQAAAALNGLAAIDRDATDRLATATRYEAGLKDIDVIRQPPYRTDGSHVYMTYPIQVPDRTALLRHLLLSRRDCAAQHLLNCADLDCFSEFRADCPNARFVADSTVLLPTYPRYGAFEADRTTAAIRDFFGRG